MENDLFELSRSSTDATAIKCEYSKDRDSERVMDGLSIDLADALKSGKVVPIELPDTQNGLTDPNEIHGRVQDEFDAAAMVAAANERRKQHAANKQAAAQRQQQQQQQQTPPPSA